MIHKCQGLPSQGWLNVYLRKYKNQRVFFELAKTNHRYQWLVKEGAFNADLPIVVSGVYFGARVRPENWTNLFDRGEKKIYLRFSKVTFSQGKTTTRSPISRSHYDHKNEDNEFELSDMRGLDIAERLRSMAPRIGHTPGRINYSDRSSGSGSLSKQELDLPPRGSDSF